jgi:hypothetical protein
VYQHIIHYHPGVFNVLFSPTCGDLCEYGTALTTVLPILFLSLNTEISMQRLIYPVTTELLHISWNLLRSCLDNPRCLCPVESTVTTKFLVLSQIYPLQLLLLIKELHLTVQWPPGNRKTRKKTNQATKLHFRSNWHHSPKGPQYQENYYGKSIRGSH